MAREEKATPSSDQRPPEKADTDDKTTTVILSEEEQRRSLIIQSVGIAVPVLAGLGSVVYLLVFFSTQSWAILVAALLVVIGGALFLIGRNVARRGRLNLAAYIMIGTTLVLLPSFTVALAGMAVILGVGTAGFAIVQVRLMLPRKHVLWAGAISVFVGLGLAFGLDRIAPQILPWPRFDATELPLLQAFVSALIGGGALAVVWQVILAFRIGSIRTRLIIAFALLLVPMIAITPSIQCSKNITKI